MQQQSNFGEIQYVELKDYILQLQQQHEALRQQQLELVQYYNPRLVDLKELKFEVDLLRRRFGAWQVMYTFNLLSVSIICMAA